MAACAGFENIKQVWSSNSGRVSPSSRKIVYCWLMDETRPSGVGVSFRVPARRAASLLWVAFAAALPQPAVAATRYGSPEILHLAADQFSLIGIGQGTALQRIARPNFRNIPAIAIDSGIDANPRPSNPWQFFLADA